MDDPYNLARFVTAQNESGTFDRAIEEIRRGHKVSHWMWFVFPQIAGLGFTDIAAYFAISSLAEAQAYLSHPVLGPRLRDCANILAAAPGTDPVAIFGTVDSLKLRSSMTLFLRAAPGEAVFAAVLDRFYGGVADDATDRKL